MAFENDSWVHNRHQCLHFPPKWGGWGGQSPPFLREKFDPPPHLGGTAQTQKSVFFEGFLRFQVRESFKNVEKRDFSAAPAAGCEKKMNYRYFSVILVNFGYFRSPHSGPNGGTDPPILKQKINTACGSIRESAFNTGLGNQDF